MSAGTPRSTPSSVEWLVVKVSFYGIIFFSAVLIIGAARFAAAVGALQTPLFVLAVLSFGGVVLAPSSEALAAIARPTIGALGAGAFLLAVAVAAYAGSRRAG